MAVEESGGSRFEEITPQHIVKGPHLSVYGSMCRLSVRAIDYYFGEAKSVTPKYDADADELALIPYPDKSGLRTLTPEDHGATVALKSILQSRGIGINVGELPGTVRLPVEVDPDEGVPYVPLTPLREAIEEGEVEESTGADHEADADEGVSESGEAHPTIDTTELDMGRVRSLLPPGRSLMDVVRLCNESESVLGVSRALRISREDTRALLREVGLEGTVSQVDGRLNNIGGEEA